MVLVLSREDVRNVLDMSEVIDAVEAALIASSQGEAIQPVRLRMPVPRHQSRIVAMPAYLGSIDAMALKVVTGAEDNARRGVPYVMALVMLCDPTTGEFLAVMDGTYLTAVRTAAASAVATKHLALPDASVLGILGAGAQARAQMWAISVVRPIRQVKVHDMLPERALEFQREMLERLGLPVEACATAERAVRDSDVVVTATTTRTPVLRGCWLKEGAHVNAIGAPSPDAREMDTEAVCRGKVVADSLEALFNESGDILIPMSEGRLKKEQIYGEIGEIAAGRKPGRVDGKEITIFKSQGIAVEDVATARLAYQRARERGLGALVDV